MPVILTTIETTAICLLFFSLFMSKAGIYIGLCILLLLQLHLFIRNQNYRQAIQSNKFLCSFGALFLLGILCTISLENSDAFIFFRKACIFLLFPILYFQLRKKNNLRWAQFSLLAGLMIGLAKAFHTFYMMPEWSGERISSFWDLGRWSECLGYSVAILLPLIFERRKHISVIKRGMYTILVIACIAALIISGGRGPLLAILIVSSLYFLFRAPKILLPIAISLFALFYLGKSFEPIEAIHQRIASISDLENNDSNKARLIMWQQGVNFAAFNLTNHPQEFLFGVGIQEFEAKYRSFLTQTNDIELLLKQTNGNISLNDLHNTYLDLTAKLGVIYAISYLVLLIITLNFFLKYRTQVHAWAYSGACLIATYGINSVFYTSGLEYQTTILFTLVALCYARVNTELNKNV